MNFKIHFLAPLFIIATTVPVALACSGAAQAQVIRPDQSEYPETGPGSLACQVAGEAIINLTPAYFGTPVVWDALYGDRHGKMRLAGAVTLDNRNVLASGDVLDAQDQPTEHLLVELDRRGRSVAEKRYPSKNGNRTAGIVKSGDGFVTVASISAGKAGAEKTVRLAWYDAAYALRRDVMVREAGFDLEAMNISPSTDGRGVIAVIKATSRQDASRDHAMLARFSADGKPVWKRAYSPGTSNHLYNLAVVDGGHYLATGQIRHEDGRMAGWLLKLNQDGTIAWQRTYPRGQFAMLRDVVRKEMKFGADRYIATGQIMPYGSEPGAAWVIEVDDNGATIWQRYLRIPEFDLDGRGVLAYPDERSTILVNARAQDREGPVKNHIRLLTLSPRGILLDDQAYMEGHAAEARQLIPGWTGERIVTSAVEIRKMPGDQKPELITDALARREKEQALEDALAESGDTPPEPGENDAALLAADNEARHESWVFVATRPAVYNDPCILPPADPAQ